MNLASNLNRTQSSSGELNTSSNTNRGVSYNDLCFPKTSNYGSMKKKKGHHVNFVHQVPVPNGSINSVGVDCRLSPSIHSMSPLARSPPPPPQGAYHPSQQQPAYPTYPSPGPYQQQGYHPYYA